MQGDSWKRECGHFKVNPISGKRVFRGTGVALVAQMEEQFRPKETVGGSNPSEGTLKNSRG